MRILVADWLRQSAHQCRKCRHLQSDGACVARCPTMKYRDNTTVCQPCHAHCHPDVGCTGPDNGVGPGRCTDCAFFKLAEDLTTVMECLSPVTEECEPGYYKRPHRSSSRRRKVMAMVLTYCASCISSCKSHRQIIFLTDHTLSCCFELLFLCLLVWSHVGSESCKIE